MRDRRAIRDLFAAQDPAHARVTTAVAVTAGMLASALFGQFVVHTFHADAGLLAMSIFLSVQAGSMVKDSTAAARVVSTALLVPALLIAVVVAALLSAHRPVVIAGFIVVTGAAIWVRKYGPRAAAIGSLSFMGYFFTLFMKPTLAELPAFALVAAGAVVAQLMVRAVLLLKRPRRELEVLLRELRAGSAAAVHVADRTSPDGRSARALRNALARLDDVGRAITGWQHSFRTESHVAADEQDFAEQVLDARVDTEEACFERARRGDGGPDETIARAEKALFTILSERVAPQHERAARDAAEDLIRKDDAQIVEVEAYLLARSAVSHARLRDVDLTHGLDDLQNTGPDKVPGGHGPDPDRALAPRAATPATPSASPSRGSSARRFWVPWREWAPTSRMAVQAMIAALIATGVGEAISASRWYWAVMTAFVIFIGATTRSGILTRAYRRLAGTAIGIGVGLAAVALAGSAVPALVAICVIAVFGMLYLGPLNYLYSAASITTMLVALYRMLGVLDGSILELRLVETASGAVIGVLSAYVILSANSRPVLIARVDDYFGALGSLLSGASPDRLVERAELLRRLHDLETAQTNLDQTVASMSTAFIVGNGGGPRRENEAVHLMYVVTRAAARLVQAVLARPQDDPRESSAVTALVGAIDDVTRVAEAAQRLLDGGSSADQSAAENADGPVPVSLVVDKLRDLPPGDPSARDAVLALARIDWALQRIVGGGGSAATARLGKRGQAAST